MGKHDKVYACILFKKSIPAPSQCVLFYAVYLCKVLPCAFALVLFEMCARTGLVSEKSAYERDCYRAISMFLAKAVRVPKHCSSMNRPSCLCAKNKGVLYSI